jgi:uncharacterized membrane protein YgdD (TMEM256/DUF423 family)
LEATVTSEFSAKTMLVAGGLLGFLSVLLGAFAAHGLSHTLSSSQLATWQTGVSYQMYHALALLFIGLWLRNSGPHILKTAGILFCIGTLGFSGSIYALVLTSATWLGPVTPLGGLCLISGWLCLCWAGTRAAVRGDGE